MPVATKDSAGRLLELPLDLDSQPPKLPMQQAFMNDAVRRFVGYGGGFANGKTTGGAVKALGLSTLFPRNQGMICRWEKNDLLTSTMHEFFRICPPGIYKKNDQLGTLTFRPSAGGSTILYQGLKDGVIGPNLGWFWIDQAEEVPEACFIDLVGRLRKETPVYDPEGRLLGYAPQQGFVTFNPEGSGHWLWKYFHEDSVHKLPDSHLYMASTYDALKAGFIRQDYIDGILRTYPEAAQKRYLEGSWDAFEGRIYPQFDPSVHRIPKIPLQPSWRLFESIDHGFVNPTAVGWWILTPPCALCKQPTRILIDQHYEGDGKGVAHHAAIIKARRSQFTLPITVTYLDNACWANNQSKGTLVYAIKDEFLEHGVVAVAAAKDWDVAYSRITQSLLSCPGAVHPVTGETNVPHFFYVDHCLPFEQEALGYVWKKQRGGAMKNATDEPIESRDHHMDQWYYFESSHPAPPPAMTPAQTQTPLERIAKLRETYNPLMDRRKTAGSWMSV